jgi:hypothetical protein
MILLPSRKNMQQFPNNQTSRSLSTRRDGSALPSVPLSLSPVYVPAAERQKWPQLPVYKRHSPLRRALPLLFLYGSLLGCCFWLAFPLLYDAMPDSIAAHSLTTAFPWLSRLFWTNGVPFLVAALAHVSWLDLHTNPAQAAGSLLLILLGMAFFLLFLAMRVCQYAVRKRVERTAALWLLGLFWLFTLLFGALFVFLPGGSSQDILRSALYGRLISVHHVNPYLASANLLASDSLYRALPPGVAPTSGPLWLDLTVPLTFFTQGKLILVLMVFRLAGLFLHLLNILLIWAILSKLKPEARLTGTLLYAWNPALLLLGISEMNPDSVVIFFLLLSIFFLQRRALLVSWICLLLAALINPFCLLLAPLFLHTLAKETRTLAGGRRALWWMGWLFFSALVLVLTYAPYWPGLGIGGIAFHLRKVFWQDTAQHSLLAALGQLPFAAWSPVAWILTPHHWLIIPALVIGILLLLGTWIAENVELSLLFGSWIFLALAILMPIGSPWLILIPFVLTLASSSRRTALLAHLLSIGSLVAYYLLLWPGTWGGQALVTIGLPLLIWGWTLFFLSTWQITHPENEEIELASRTHPLLSISRPSWPSRPSAWPSHLGARQR